VHFSVTPIGCAPRVRAAVPETTDPGESFRHEVVEFATRRSGASVAFAQTLNEPL